MNILSRGVALLRLLVFHRLFYYVLAWVLALFAAGLSLYSGWVSFDNRYMPEEEQRNDGNGGHATIDFGGQYLMGRMLVTGNGGELYNRAVQRQLLTEVYPVADQCPIQKRSDVELLMGWVMGEDDPTIPKAFAVVLTPLAAHDAVSCVAHEAARELAREPDDPRIRGDECLAEAGQTFDWVGLPWGRQEPWSNDRVARIGRLRSVGGPLYPPINAFFYAPLALLPPREGYRANQVVNVLLVFVAAAGISVITRGGVWWPTAALVLYVFPGTSGSVNLGQNAVLTLAIAVWGWALVSRGKPGWGGVVWGLLAFKPVWALALFLVPLLSRRWRMCLTMVLTGAVLALLTVPVVGVHAWLEWLQVGRYATAVYNVDDNWIHLSRDLLSIPRRYLLNFGKDEPREPTWYPPPTTGLGFFWHQFFGDREIPAWLWPSLMGWVLVAFVLETTVRTAVLRAQEVKAVVGPAAAFLFLGAWMCCFHFMYYDVLLAALPIFLLWHDPGEFLRPIYMVLWVQRGRLAGSDFDGYHGPHLMDRMPPPPPTLPLDYRHVWVLNRMVPTLTLLVILSQYALPALGFDSFYRSPRDTLWMMLLWAWCFVLWIHLAWSVRRRGEALPVRMKQA